ncbi:ABC transporter permease [Lactiplantibacillus sp. WILCCON 0030]|uniref:ABC transporter permease n=1 Tax=Lactiplantibacillus brownii TaxID=3069269 RepID=A0ABU1A5A6_9LACO|nr:ABC transporter permease [Lactiplantibacillus brownii]MDQ7936128.1 ABC transporter permease [Lactiplantibacillus brownii]
MTHIDTFSTALRSLKSHPKRSFLTILGIVIGVAAVIAIISLGNGLKSATLRNLQTTHSGQQTAEISYTSNDYENKDNGFDNGDITLLLNTSSLHLNKVKLINEDGVKTPASMNVDLNGKEVEKAVKFVKKSNLILLAGRQITISDNNLRNNVVLINEKTSNLYFINSKTALHNNIDVEGTSYRIIGVFKNIDSIDETSTDMVIPRASFNENKKTTGSNKIKIIFDNGINVNRTSKKASNLLNKKGSHKYVGSYTYTNLGAILEGIGSVIKGLTYFISAIAGISLFIAGIGVMNMMYISVSERTQEIGIRLAIGATRQNIMEQFLLEAIILTSLGGVLGLVIGGTVAYSISLFLPFRAVITLGSVVLAVGVSTIVGLIFGLLPAKQASNQNLIDVLR